MTDDPVGSGLWGDLDSRPQDPRPLGYPALALREQLEVGSGPDATLSEAWGLISSAEVATQLRRSRPLQSIADDARIFDFGRVVGLTREGPAATYLPDTRFVAVPDTDGRIVAAGRALSGSPVLDLAAGRTVAHSLAALPQIAEMQRAFGSRVQSEVMGTDLIMKPAVDAERLPPARLKRILRETGLSRLPRPVTVGLAYVAGGPRT